MRDKTDEMEEQRTSAIIKTITRKPGAQSSVSVALSPDIFKLNIICFHELFEWLSLNELLAIAKTCTRLQEVAGDFYRSHYVSKRVTGEKSGICIEYRPLDIISNYITKVYISGNRLKVYSFIGSNCKSLRQIRLEGALPEGGIECINEILKNIEIIDLDACLFYEEFFDYILRHCTKMKSLSVKRSEKIRNKSVIIGSGNEWLLQNYPKLENFELAEL